MVMAELDRALTMFPGDKMYDYLTKNDVGKSDAKTGVTMIKGMVKDFKVRKWRCYPLFFVKMSFFQIR